jgi:hypothetical protein
MQINTVWIAPLAQHIRQPENMIRQRLLREPCFNIAAAGAIMRIYLNEENGDLMRAIGDYHSHRPVRNQLYRLKVLEAAERLLRSGSRVPFRGEILQHSLRDRTKKYSYSLDIKEILVAGELAVVRLAWRLRGVPDGSPDHRSERRAVRRPDDDVGRWRRSGPVAICRLRPQHRDAAPRDHVGPLGSARPRQSSAIYPRRQGRPARAANHRCVGPRCWSARCATTAKAGSSQRCATRTSMAGKSTRPSGRSDERFRNDSGTKRL